MNNFNPNFYMSVHTCSKMSINACLQGFCPFDDAKVGTKKTSQKLWNVLGKNWERLGRFWEKTTRFLSSFATFYLILVLLHNNHRTASSHHPEAGSHPICPHPPSQISGS